jgi:hypothetical protein
MSRPAGTRIQALGSDNELKLPNWIAGSLFAIAIASQLNNLTFTIQNPHPSQIGTQALSILTMAARSAKRAVLRTKRSR